MINSSDVLILFVPVSNNYLGWGGDKVVVSGIPTCLVKFIIKHTLGKEKERSEGIMAWAPWNMLCTDAEKTKLPWTTQRMIQGLYSMLVHTKCQQCSIKTYKMVNYKGEFKNVWINWMKLMILVRYTCLCKHWVT